LDSRVGGQRGGDGAAGPVQAEHLAAEVVGADGEEVHCGRERRRVRGGRCDLDHDAELRRFLGDLDGCLGESAADRGHLVQRPDHRHQHGQPGAVARAQDRGELVAERLRCVEERRQSLLFLVLEERRDLVAGEVE